MASTLETIKTENQTSLDNQHAINQYDTLVAKQIVKTTRMKLGLLVATYMYQMTKGCILPQDSCPNEHCFKHKGMVNNTVVIILLTHLSKGIKQEENEQTSKTAIRLASEAFVKNGKPTYYFCPCPCIYLPDFTADGHPTIQLQAIQNLLLRSDESKDYTPAVEIVKQCFSNIDSINGSFLTVSCYLKES
jgi:hypothetical protein